MCGDKILPLKFLKATDFNYVVSVFVINYPYLTKRVLLLL